MYMLKHTSGLFFNPKHACPLSEAPGAVTFNCRDRAERVAESLNDYRTDADSFTVVYVVPADAVPA